MPTEEQMGITSEKPEHYRYLKEFRTQQCPLFLQHKCTQHRPYTCFHWHFMNQRRRRPIKKRDGTFGYSADIYCTKYDETTGICPDGENCPFLHRTAGDTERRYHLRYYKTCTCVHETNEKGNCVKNGPHCAFAHGPLDLRQPVYDIRELQSAENEVRQGQVNGDTPGASQLEKDRCFNEDPRWNDTKFVLSNYKTEPCLRPPRLCRQGYACPSFHNTRDRRRSPLCFKYRSTPCPNVKHGDDWGDPAQCDSADKCSYCHTRTEQQFHPEIYKSTKCNDMVQTSYCPRGPFCAFAHVENEMILARDLASGVLEENSLAAFVTNALPTNNNTLQNQGRKPLQGNAPLSIKIPEPIGTERTTNVESPLTSYLNFCSKARGYEDSTAALKQQIANINKDPNLDAAEKEKRKYNLLVMHVHLANSGRQGNNFPAFPMFGSNPQSASRLSGSAMSPSAVSFYPPIDTVESVIGKLTPEYLITWLVSGNALEDDLPLGDLTVCDRETDGNKEDNDTNSVCSSFSGGFNSYIGPSSVPVSIPSGGSIRTSEASSSLSNSPVTVLRAELESQEKQKFQDAAAAFWSRPNPGKFSAPSGITHSNGVNGSAASPGNTAISNSPLLGGSVFSMTPTDVELQRLREEDKRKIAQWEEGIAQARMACDAWKKEAAEAARKQKQADENALIVVRQRDEALQEIKRLKAADVSSTAAPAQSPYLRCLRREADLEQISFTELTEITKTLREDLETIEKLSAKCQQQQKDPNNCIICDVKSRCTVLHPCQHFVCCDSCAGDRNSCPFCQATITKRVTVNQ